MIGIGISLANTPPGTVADSGPVAPPAPSSTSDLFLDPSTGVFDNQGTAAVTPELVGNAAISNGRFVLDGLSAIRLPVGFMNQLTPGDSIIMRDVILTEGQANVLFSIQPFISGFTANSFTLGIESSRLGFYISTNGQSFSTLVRHVANFVVGTPYTIGVRHTGTRLELFYSTGAFDLDTATPVFTSAFTGDTFPSTLGVELFGRFDEDVNDVARTNNGFVGTCGAIEIILG